MVVDGIYRGSIIYLNNSPKEVMFCKFAWVFNHFLIVIEVGTLPHLFHLICLLCGCLLFAIGDLWTIIPSVDVSVCAS